LVIFHGKEKKSYEKFIGALLKTRLFKKSQKASEASSRRPPVFSAAKGDLGDMKSRKQAGLLTNGKISGIVKP
jgi:hypothetical protein